MHSKPVLDQADVARLLAPPASTPRPNSGR
jgi:hypothetical protein